MQRSRRIAIVAAWLALACFAGPLVAILVQIVGLFAWPQESMTDEYAVAITAFAVLPRLAFVGILPGIIAVALGTRVLREGGGATALAIGVPALVFCSAVSSLAVAQNVPLIPY
jgi:hypothetical protein